MEINGVKIRVPEGMEPYIEDGEIRFRKKLSLDEVYKQLFLNRTMYYMGDSGWICKREDNFDAMIPYDNRTIANNCTSERQVEKLLAIIKLMNVAKYLNKGWQPNWNSENDSKYYICIDATDLISIERVGTVLNSNTGSIVYFSDYPLAQQAIEILGEETIKLALSTDW